jgi:hypothetical protein
MIADNGQKAICEECGIANKSVLRCAQTTAPECACMQMALVYAAQHAGEVQSVLSVPTGYIAGTVVRKQVLELIGEKS